MTQSIPVETVRGDLLVVLQEAFESVQGLFLDKGTSLLETLAEISAAEASIAVGGRCATIAAQVAHVCFYLDVLDRYLSTGQMEQADWGEVWRTVSTVTPAEWDALRERLRQGYLRARQGLIDYDRWETQYSVAGSVGLIAHTAYHLGEIRQATCTVKQS
jgi:hypothetical protein